MGKKRQDLKIHPTAIISDSAEIGDGSIVWAFVQIMDNAKIGEKCVVGNGVYIDRNVKIGNNEKIHNKACIYDGTIIENNVFIGPGVYFTNDKYPRHNKTRKMEGISWKVGKFASIVANVTVLPRVNIGENSTVGVGSVVTKDVPEGVLVYGNPAIVKGKTVRSDL